MTNIAQPILMLRRLKTPRTYREATGCTFHRATTVMPLNKCFMVFGLPIFLLLM